MPRVLINMLMMTTMLTTLAVCQNKGSVIMSEKKLESAILGGGSFWCVEAVYERVKGVQNVVSGYAGGHL